MATSSDFTGWVEAATDLSSGGTSASAYTGWVAAQVDELPLTEWWLAGVASWLPADLSTLS